MVSYWKFKINKKQILISVAHLKLGQNALQVMMFDVKRTFITLPKNVKTKHQKRVQNSKGQFRKYCKWVQIDGNTKALAKFLTFDRGHYNLLEDGMFFRWNEGCTE